MTSVLSPATSSLSSSSPVPSPAPLGPGHQSIQARRQPLDRAEAPSPSRSMGAALQRQSSGPILGLQQCRAKLLEAKAKLTAGAHEVVQSPAWARLSHIGALTAAASGLSVVVGLACAGTVTPWFLNLTLPQGTVVNMFSQVPFIGAFLTAIIQRGGPFGALCSSLVLWFGTRAMFSQGTVQDRRRDWALAAVAVGFALSPVFVPAVPVSGALAAGCLLGTVALGYLTSRAHLPQGGADWRVNLIAIAVGVAFAPMGAQAAMAVSQAAILGEALSITTLCSLGIAVHGLIGVLAPLFRENVAAARNAEAIDAQALRLDRPGTVDPTVFGAEAVQDFLEYMDSLAEDMHKGIPWPSRFLVLRGPSGAGKQSIAMAELLRLDIPIECPSQETLRASGSPASALREFFEKCKERARVTQRPVAIFIKDIDHLLGQRHKGDAENDQMVNAALLYLNQLDGATPSNLLIIGTIDDSSPLDGALSSRATHFHVPRNSPMALTAILQSRLRRNFEATDVIEAVAPANRAKGLALPEALAAEVGQKAYGRNLTGRDMVQYAERLTARVRHLYRYYKAQHARGSRPFDVQEALRGAHAELWPKLRPTPEPKAHG